MACIKKIMRLGWMYREETFEIRSCAQILANDIKVNTTDQYMLYS